jgi:hypothetical protein
MLRTLEEDGGDLDEGGFGGMDFDGDGGGGGGSGMGRVVCSFA